MQKCVAVSIVVCKNFHRAREDDVVNDLSLRQRPCPSEPAAGMRRRPRLAFRIGVSGTRQITLAHEPEVAAAAASLLSFVAEQVRLVAERPEARATYDQLETPLLRVLSSLADGSDRLLARLAMAQGFLLEAVLPFARTAYEDTFGTQHQERVASIADFAALLAEAGPRILTLDGHHVEAHRRHRSYGAAGQTIVHNCDLLVAIWDGSDVDEGKGGTVDAVLFALRNGVPVWCIHPETATARFLVDDIALVARGSTLAGEALTDLGHYLARILIPPPAEVSHSELWHKLIHALRGFLKFPDDPLAAYLAEGGVQNRAFWNLHPEFMGWLRRHGGRQTRGHAVSTAVPVKPIPPAAGRWTRPWRLFHRNRPSDSSSHAAGLSRIYRDRYRSSYLIILFCGAVALLASVSGLAFPAGESVALGIELCALISILLLVFMNEAYRWHGRYISYRLLGELKRVAAHPRHLGWTVAVSRAQSLAPGPEHWVGWLFNAETRSVSLAEGALDPARVEAIRDDASGAWIASQVAWHKTRRDECKGAAEILSWFGRAMFLLTLLLVALRIVLHNVDGPESVGEVLSLLCVVLPTVSAAFFGVKAYEELDVLSDQSDRMVDELEVAQRRLGRIEVEESLSSQRLGRELQKVASLMLGDLQGWAQLFRLKALET